MHPLLTVWSRDCIAMEDCVQKERISCTYKFDQVNSSRDWVYHYWMSWFCRSRSPTDGEALIGGSSSFQFCLVLHSAVCCCNTNMLRAPYEASGSTAHAHKVFLVRYDIINMPWAVDEIFVQQEIARCRVWVELITTTILYWYIFR